MMSETSGHQAESLVRIARRRARSGCEQAYEALIRGMFADARKISGFAGAELIPPAQVGDEYQVVMRFETQAALAAWDCSAERAIWHERLLTVAEGAPDYRVLSGLEAWFAGPLVVAPRPPSKLKMAFVTWLGIFPTVSCVLAFIAPLLDGLPFLLRVAVITLLVVVVMTWLVMPRLTRLLKAWLISN